MLQVDDQKCHYGYHGTWRFVGAEPQGSAATIYIEPLQHTCSSLTSYANTAGEQNALQAIQQQRQIHSGIVELMYFTPICIRAAYSHRFRLR